MFLSLSSQVPHIVLISNLNYIKIEPDKVSHKMLALPKLDMNFANFEILAIYFYFFILDIPNRSGQYLGLVGRREESKIKKFQPEPELGDREAEVPAGGEGGHLMGPGSH